MADPSDPPAEPYAKNTKEQYETLGRFVESFEAMVNEVREICIELLSKDGHHRDLIEIAFHHQVMTSKPLLEIMRATIIEIVNDAIARKRDLESGVIQLEPPHMVDGKDNAIPFTNSDREIFLAVMKVISEEYINLANMRNNLLHATWFVGYTSTDDPSSSEFYVRKYSVTKQGLSSLPLPKNADEMRKLSDRCDATRTWLYWLYDCITGADTVQVRFERGGKNWLLVTPAGHKTTLPEK